MFCLNKAVLKIICNICVFFWNVCVFLKLEVNVLDAYETGTESELPQEGPTWCATLRFSLAPSGHPYEHFLEVPLTAGRERVAH